MRELSAFLKFIRVQRGWSQQQVAVKMQMSVPSFSKMEGGRTDINLSRLVQLAEVYDIPLTELLACGKKGTEGPPAIQNVRKLLLDRETLISDLQDKIDC